MLFSVKLENKYENRGLYLSAQTISTATIRVEKRKTTISHFFIQDLEALRIISRFLKAVIRSKFNVFLTSLAVRGRMLQLGAT